MARTRRRFTMFRPRVYSRHSTHDVLRPYNRELPLLPFRSVIRLGSTTDKEDTVTNGGDRIEVNTIDAVKNSSNKLYMKRAFSNSGVKTADWWTVSNYYGEYRFTDYNGNISSLEDLTFPIVTKSLYGSRNMGNIKHDTPESFINWAENRSLNNYIIEKFYSYSREYRLHVTSEGCFYAIRKMLRQDTPEEHRWYRNDDHCVWILEENELFDKPVNWDSIVEYSVKALESVGLDIGAIDVKIQSATNRHGDLRDYPEFIILETNSAPSFGELTSQKYIEELPNILRRKYQEFINQ